jgi:hypothetical protein
VDGVHLQQEPIYQVLVIAIGDELFYVHTVKLVVLVITKDVVYQLYEDEWFMLRRRCVVYAIIHVHD